MGSKISRCLGLNPYAQVQEDYVAHPGQSASWDIKTFVEVTFDENYGENPESNLYEGTEV
jgi:hypothetical protein